LNSRIGPAQIGSCPVPQRQFDFFHLH
jgi:hypothetical protein